jgi:sulfoxide reductase heme-binding subunit YedZ
MVLMRKLKARWAACGRLYRRRRSLQRPIIVPQILTHVAALLPLVLLVWDYWQGRLIIDPVKEITTRTGKTALILLILSLACTPIRTIFGFKWVKHALRVRRALGLYAFMYAGLHFLTFVGLDYGFDFDLIAQDILDQRYVLVGLAAGLLLLPLAITSTKGWQRRLGKNWKRLHRLVYLAGILAIVHFVWLAKDNREPLRYGAVVALLLFMRIPGLPRQWFRTRSRRENREGSLT